MKFHPDVEEQTNVYSKKMLLNTLFYGPSGSGKHTLAMNLLKQLFGVLGKPNEYVDEVLGIKYAVTSKYIMIDGYEWKQSKVSIAKCIEALKAKRDYDEIIYMTPDAKTLNQSMSNTLSLQKNILILTGHYKGVDQRVRDKYITKEISIGDYVLTGGELAAAVLVDSIVRLIPGVIGDETSALTDSFQDNLLSPPVYTRPSNYEGMEVPQVLLSGNFPKIEEWRSEKAYERTQQIRPDLLDETL